MNWDTVLQYVPDGLCILLCLFGCLCNWVRTGSLKKMLQLLCPSTEPLKALENRVIFLEEKFSKLSQVIDAVLNDVDGEGDDDNGDDN